MRITPPLPAPDFKLKLGVYVYFEIWSAKYGRNKTVIGIVIGRRLLWRKGAYVIEYDIQVIAWRVFTVGENEGIHPF